MRLAAVILVGATLALSACRTTEEIVDPDAVYGHRFDGSDPEGRAIVDVEPPPPGVEYFVYPAVVHELDLRLGPPDAQLQRPLELIAMGAFPDTCMHLYAVREEQIGHLINVTLEMWRPKGALCTRVVRPFRFYHELAMPLSPGPYTLTFNDETRPFELLPPEPE